MPRAVIVGVTKNNHMSFHLAPPARSRPSPAAVRLARPVLAAGCILFANTTFADGRVSGRVTDANTRSATVGADLELEGTGLRTSTERGGEFSFRSVPAGQYTLITSSIGYEPTRTSITVADNETARVEVFVGEEVVMLETFEVVGFAEGRAKALNQQKASQTIMNVVSSDSFGDYPDKSIADAARRLPGVTIERGQGQGEGRYVSIRGMNADFNAVSLNGVRVTVSNFDNASRSVPLDVIAIKSAETITVSKALRPDEDADSIGGSINIRSRSAFDREGRSASVDASINYSNLVDSYGKGFYLDDKGHEVSASFSDTFGEKNQWAFAFTANTRETPYASQSVGVRGWGSVVGAGTFTGFLAPTGLLLEEFFDQVENTGGTFALEFKPTESDHLRLNTSFSERDSRRGRQRQEIRYDLSQTFWVPGAPVSTSGNTITGFTSDNRLFREVRDFYETQEHYGVALDGKHERGDNTLTWLAGFNRGNFDGDPNKDLWLTFRTGFSDNRYDLGGAGGTYFPSFSASRDRNNPSNFRLTTVDLGTRFTEDDEFVLRSDFQRDTLIFGGEGFWKFGTQARFKKRELTSIDRFYSQDTSALNPNSDSGLNWNPGSNFLGQGVAAVNYGPSSSVDGTYNYGFFIDPNISRQVVNQLLADGTLRFSPAGQLDSDLRSKAGSYDATEDIYSLYGMGQTTLDKWTFMAGVRGELTRTSFDTFSGVSSGGLFTSVRPENETNDYLDVLPGAHVRYEATRDLIFRAAVTRSIARASYSQLNPSRQVNNTALTVTQGDTDLDPTRSTNLDLMVDYYVGRVGLLSAGVFYKDMTDNVYRLSRTELGSNVPEAPIGNAGSTYTISDWANAEGAEVYGFEVGFERDLSFLPSPFDGLGVFSNFTFTDSEVETGIPGRQGLTTPLFGQVEKSYNVGLTYKNYGFSGRIAYNWRDSYLDFGGLNANPALDRYLDKLGSLDVRLDYTFNKGITLFTEFRNVTNSPDRAYAGDADVRPTYNEYRDWSATVGLRWSL